MPSNIAGKWKEIDSRFIHEVKRKIKYTQKKRRESFTICHRKQAVSDISTEKIKNENRFVF